MKAYNDEGIDVHFYFSVMDWSNPDYRYEDVYKRQSQSFCPAFDYLVGTESSRLVTFVRAVEFCTVDQSTFICLLYTSTLDLLLFAPFPIRTHGHQAVDIL